MSGSEAAHRQPCERRFCSRSPIIAEPWIEKYASANINTRFAEKT